MIRLGVGYSYSYVGFTGRVLEDTERGYLLRRVGIERRFRKGVFSRILILKELNIFYLCMFLFYVKDKILKEYRFIAFFVKRLRL